MWVVGAGMDLDAEVDFDVEEEDSEDGAGGDDDNVDDVGVCVPQSIIRSRSNAHVTHMRVAAVGVVDNCGCSSM